MEEKFHINIHKDRLLKMGLPVGPWLTEFKKALREGRPGERVITVGDKAYDLGQLSHIALITKGQKISYATDVAMSDRNEAKLVSLIAGSDIFCCEAYFLERDRERALERSHLTARTCGRLAKEAAVKKLVITHISPKYSDCPETVIGEAMTAFTGG